MLYHRLPLMRELSAGRLTEGEIFYSVAETFSVSPICDTAYVHSQKRL